MWGGWDGPVYSTWMLHWDASSLGVEHLAAFAKRIIGLIGTVAAKKGYKLLIAIIN